MKYASALKIMLCFFLLTMLVACEPPYTYSTALLHGKGGAAEGWIYTDGTIRTNGDVTINGTLANCRLIFTLDPLKTGEVKLGNIFNLSTITYVYFENNNPKNVLFSKGKYEITEITQTHVRGRMYIYNDTMSFNGTFELVRTSY